jgi:hypothetical protein
MASSILTLQMTALNELVLSMTKLAGYNFDWTTTQNRNYAIGQFPRAEIYRMSEDNLDSIDGLGSNDYTNNVSYEIHIAQKITTSSANPIFDIVQYFDQALDDLKMLFGKAENRSLSGTCCVFMYKGHTQEYKAVDQFIPTKLITKWEAVYAQDRAIPTQLAGS